MKLSPEDVKSLKDPSATGDGWNNFSYVNQEAAAGNTEMMMQF
jgi:hypothetical protein